MREQRIMGFKLLTLQSGWFSVQQNLIRKLNTEGSCVVEPGSESTPGNDSNKHKVLIISQNS